MNRPNIRMKRLLAMVLCIGLLCAMAGAPAARAAQKSGIFVRPLAGGVAQVAMSPDHIAVLRSDGTVAAAGNNDWKQCNVSGWTGIVKIWACKGATVGLTEDGSVVSTCALLPTWKNIVDVSIYRFDRPDVVVLAGLRENGTAISVAANRGGLYPLGPGVCDVSFWQNITQLTICNGIYGLKEDGSVVYTGFAGGNVPQISPTTWKGVRELVQCGGKLFGLTEEGSVMAQSSAYGCEKWKNVISLVCAGDALFGILENGTVVCGGDVLADCTGLTGVKELAVSGESLMALLEDGSLVIRPDPKMTWQQQQQWSDVQQLVTNGQGTQVAALRRDGTVAAGTIGKLAQAAPCHGWTNVARLYCCGDTWLALKEDGTLLCSDTSLNMKALTAGIADTRPRDALQGLLAAGVYHSVYLRDDGTVSGAGQTSLGRLDVEGWTDITAVSANGHTVGLKADGTVLAVGPNASGQCKVETWKDIVAISAGGSSTMGLTSKGTVVMAGSNLYGQMDLAGRRDIAAISAGGNTAYALTLSGTVVSAGSNSYGQRNLDTWTAISAISAGTNHVVGLKADGTVVAAGDNRYGQCDVSGWTDIVAISAGATHTVGLKSNGSVVFAGSNRFGQGDILGWKNVVAISTGTYHTIAINATGTFLTAGSNAYGQRDIGH